MRSIPTIARPSVSLLWALPAILLMALLLGLCFRLGEFSADSFKGQVLEAQGGRGRGPVRPKVPEPTKRPDKDKPLVFSGDGGSSAAANGFIAVTGSYGVGNSVLYVLDTESRQLAVYEARGGSPSMRRLVLVGARRIDLDLRLVDYNDESEYKRGELERLFDGGSKGRRTKGQPRTETQKGLRSPLDRGRSKDGRGTRGR